MGSPDTKDSFPSISSSNSASFLHLDSFLDQVLVRLARRHSSATGSPARLTIAPHRLRHVGDLIESNLGSGITLADVASATDMSAPAPITVSAPRRGFALLRHEKACRHQTGGSARVQYALRSISEHCGLCSGRQSRSLFKRHVGLGPEKPLSCYYLPGTTGQAGCPMALRQQER